MEYPKAVMKISELKRMGFPEEWLMYVFRIQGRKSIAWKSGPAEKSPILFDTMELEKFRKAQCVS